MDKLKDYTPYCDSIAWDGCHKIYILMDSDQTDKMKGYGYTYLITRKSGADLDGTIEAWYRESCPLRFVQVVATDYQHEDGEVFEDVYGQFEEVY